MKRFTLLSFFFLLFYTAIQAQTAPPFWKDIVAFKQKDSVQAPPSNAILIVGSSSFTKWQDVSDYFPGYTIINRGFGGSTLPDVIRYFYDVILPYKPKQVIVYCGENDLASAANISATEVVNRFKTLYGMIRQNLPDTDIDFISMKPSPSREKIQDKVKAANKEISEFLKKEKKGHFIDVYPAMLTADGKMREELYLSDRLHMKAEGYAIWKKVMQPYLLK